MRLKVSQQPNSIHSEIVTSVGWSTANELFTCSDDKFIWKWDKNGEPVSKLITLDTYCTDMNWFPAKRQTGNAMDIFVIACTDGSFRLISKNGRIEKTVEKAHVGAVTALRWSYDGTSLLTAGEDGVLKVWSRNGMLRSTLLQTGRCIYSLAWSPNDDQILLTSGKDLVVKPIQASSKQFQWQAHDSPVLKVDWNPVNNLIVSGGEDCKYKVWDCYGRILFQSKPIETVITSVLWCPDGELFAVGSFNTLRLCDKTGWSYSRERTNTGSIFNIAWTSDGTQLAGSGGNGAVCFGHITERRLNWRNVEVVLLEATHLKVSDVNTNEVKEELNFRDRVIKMSLGFNYLIVATSNQCHIYNATTWNAPTIFDLKDTVNIIMQSERNFLTIDNFTGIQVYNYDGRHLCNPKFKGLRSEFLNSNTVSLSYDYVAIVDRADSKSIHVTELPSGKQLTVDLTHNLEISEIFLNQHGPSLERKIALIDRNQDLHITPIHKKAFAKLASMVSTAIWNDTTEMLAAVVDGKFIVWYYPSVMYIDRNLVNATKLVKDTIDFGKNCQLVTFFGNQCTGRRADGALIAASVSPYPVLLYQYVEKNEWESAIRLCRFVKDNTLWSTLAAMAVTGKELNTAEVAFAAIEEVDRLQYITHIRDVPSVEGKNAELHLFKRQPEEAELILLQAGLIYRAIKLNIHLFRWERALDIAIKHKTHVDTVIGYRLKYLAQWNRTETNQKFVKFAEGVQIDWEKIRAKVTHEKEKEKFQYR